MQKRKCPKTMFDVCVKKCGPAPVARFDYFRDMKCPLVTAKNFLGVMELQLLEFMFLLFEKCSSRFSCLAAPVSRKVLLDKNTRRSGHGY